MDLESGDAGLTPLALAVMLGDTAMAELLLAAGADPQPAGPALAHLAKPLRSTMLALLPDITASIDAGTLLDLVAAEDSEAVRDLLNAGQAEPEVLTAALRRALHTPIYGSWNLSRRLELVNALLAAEAPALLEGESVLSALASELYVDTFPVHDGWLRSYPYAERRQSGLEQRWPRCGLSTARTDLRPQKRETQSETGFLPGSAGKIRTCDQSVNSRPLCH